MTDFEMPVVFYFTVSIGGAGADVDAAFQEVSGLEWEIDVETVVEGGENRFVHRLPTAVKHPNLVLKRGIAATTSDLTLWFMDVLENDFSRKITPRDIGISLCDHEGEPVRSWAIGNAYPVKWNVATLDAMKNEIAVETMELVYNTLKRND